MFDTVATARMTVNEAALVPVTTDRHTASKSKKTEI